MCFHCAFPRVIIWNGKYDETSGLTVVVMSNRRKKKIKRKSGSVLQFVVSNFMWQWLQPSFSAAAFWRFHWWEELSIYVEDADGGKNSCLSIYIRKNKLCYIVFLFICFSHNLAALVSLKKKFILAQQRNSCSTGLRIDKRRQRRYSAYCWTASETPSLLQLSQIDNP